VVLINFNITREGLEEQILSEVVRIERNDLELQKNNIITTMTLDKKQLQNLEDKILSLLVNVKGNLLEDESLLNTLNECEHTTSKHR